MKININNDLGSIPISITSDYSCKLSIIKKNNRIIMNGYIHVQGDVAPNVEVTLGTIEQSARPQKDLVIFIGELAHDAITTTVALGSLTQNGEIKVRNIFENFYARYFYFDMVWDV